MPITDKKISAAQIAAKGVVAAPDTLNGPAQQNKAIFDRLVREVVADSVNAAIDELALVENQAIEWEQQEAQRKTNEQGRVVAENSRVAAENIRVQNEDARKSNESGRVSAEQGRVSAEQNHAQAENGRMSAESTRAQAEQGRMTTEQGRAAAEGLRVTAEEGRKNAETTRSREENTRIAGEDGRKGSENTRVAEEIGRTAAEGARNQAEQQRIAGESGRVSAEGHRVTAEGARAAAEQLRASAESIRLESEQGRVAAESARNLWEEYDPLKGYLPGNKVAFNGSSYLCKEDCQGKAPTDTTYWRLIAAKGVDGQGAGDMLASVYDPGGKAQDVFGYVDGHAGDAVKHITAAEREKLQGIASGAEVNVQADWNETSAQSDAYINNKPTALKNPEALSIQQNGGAAVSYDGSTARSVNITAVGVGAETPTGAQEKIAAHNSDGVAHSNRFANYFTKDECLSGETAALFGLGVGAVPNDAFEKVLMSGILASGITGGNGANFTLALTKFTLFDGVLVRIKLNRDMVAGATLNVAGTGAKAIVDIKGRAIRAGAKAGAWLSLVYNGTNYVSQGGDIEQSTGKTVVFAKSGTFNPVAYGLGAGDAVNVICVGGGQGGEGQVPVEARGGAGAASSFGPYLTAPGGSSTGGMYGGGTKTYSTQSAGTGAGGYIIGETEWGGNGGASDSTVVKGSAGGSKYGGYPGLQFGAGGGGGEGGGGYGAGGGGSMGRVDYGDSQGGNSGYVKASVIVLTSNSSIAVSVGGGGGGSIRYYAGSAGTTSGGGVGAQYTDYGANYCGNGGYDNVPGGNGLTGGGAGGCVIISW